MEDCSSKEFDKQKSLSIDLKSTKGFTSETIQNEQINAIPSNSLDFTETFHEAPASNNTDISIKKEPEKSINACEEIKNIIETIPKVTDNDQLKHEKSEMNNFDLKSNLLNISQNNPKLSSGYKTLEKFKDENHTKPKHPNGEFPQTSILEQYANFSPKYKMIYPISDHTRTGRHVYKITLNDSRQFVVKSIKIRVNEERKIDSIAREFYIGKALSELSRNVIKIIDMKQITINNDFIIIEMLMEYGGESIEKYSGKLSPFDTLEISRQLISVLELMERVGVAHFDLKPANMVWDSTAKALKIIDFGTSISFFSTPTIVIEPLQKFADRLRGFTELYAPPELLSCDYKSGNLGKIIAQKVDVFSFGMTLINILLIADNKGEKFTQWGRTEDDLNTFLMNLDITDNLELKKEQWMEIISWCVNYIPEKRPSFKELRQKFDELVKISKDKVKSIENIEIDYKKIADAYFNLQQYDLAMIHYKEFFIFALKSNNENEQIEAYSRLFIAHSKMNHQHDCECLKITQEKIKFDFRIYENIGNEYLILKDYENAIEFYNKAIKTLDSESIQMKAILSENIGKAYALMENFDKAEEFYNNAYFLKIESKANICKSQPFENLGKIYQGFFKHKKAIELFMKALEIESKTNNNYENENIIYLYENIGNSYLCINLYDNGDKYYKLAIEKSEKIHGENKSDLYKKYGLKFVIYKQHDKIEYYCDKSLESLNKISDKSVLPTKISQIYSEFGYEYFSFEQYEKASEYFMKSLQAILETENKIELIQLFYMLGISYLHCENYEDAHYQFENVVELSKQKYGEFSATIGNLYTMIGEQYAKMRKNENAVGYFNAAFEILTNATKEEKIELARSFENVGIAYLNLNQLDLMEEYYNKAVEIYKQVLSETNIQIAYIFDFLASTFRSNYFADKSIFYYVKTAEIRKKLFGENSIELVLIYRILGEEYGKLNEYENSAESYLKAISIIRKQLGEDSFESLKIYEKLSEVYLNQNESEKAINCFNKIIKIQTDVIGKNSKEVAKSYENLGLSYLKLSKVEDCEICFKKVIKIIKRIGGENIINDLINAYIFQGKTFSQFSFLEKTIKCYDKAINKIFQKKGENNEEIASLYKELGNIFLEHEKWNESSEFFNKSIEIQLKIPEESRKQRLENLYEHIGESFFYYKIYQKSAEYYNKYIEFYMKMLSPTNYENLIKKCENLSKKFYSNGEYNLAIHFLQKTIEIKLYVKIDLNIAESYKNLGDLYLACEMAEKSLEFYQKAIEIAEENCKNDTTVIILSEYYESIGNVYDILKQYSKSIEYYEKSALLRNFSEPNLELSEFCENYAILYLKISKLDLALENTKKAIKIKYELLGSENSNLGHSFEKFANNYSNYGYHENAIEYYLKAIEIKRYKKGETNYEIAEMYEKLSKEYLLIGGHNENSEKYAKKAAEIKKKLSEIKYNEYDEDY